MKYRYMMDGSFTPEKHKYVYESTNREVLCISIPAPFARDSEREAMRDGNIVYRFVSVDGKVKIAVYPGENFEVCEDSKGNKGLNIWTVGDIFHYYDYEEFKSLGGMIYELPACAMCTLPTDLSKEELMAKFDEFKDKIVSEPWNVEDYLVDVTFDELFPSLKPEDKPVYIDDEAYSIDEVE